jgi:hypothetical protein
VGLLTIAPPLYEPVSLTELKDMLRLSPGDTSQDSVLNSLNTAARGWCEVLTQRRFVQQTIRLLMDFFPGYIDMKLVGQKVSSPFVSGSNAVLVGIRYAIVPPCPPVQSLQAFLYQNANGTVTSMIQGPTNIAAVTNTINQPIGIQTSAPHNLITGSTVAITGNAGLTAIIGQAQQPITIIDGSNFTLNGTVGTGSGISATGAITGTNFIEDLLSQPARLTPIFGQMWPVARVVVNAIQIDYQVGYATPITVTTTVGSTVLSGYTFTAANIGQPISIPGAGSNIGCLNSVIVSVLGGVATLRDQAQGGVTAATALLVNYGNPYHWELIKTAIKVLVNAWFVNRLPVYDAKQRDAIKALLGPAMDLRF